MAKMVKRICLQCQNTFLARVAEVERGWGIFCSKSCKTTYQDSGDTNPYWKGGVSIDIQQYRKLHPEKEKARHITQDAIRTGKLIRQPCEKCETTEKVEAHHEDYAKPLEVQWLCRKCHAAHHAATGTRRKAKV